jgi:two-component system NtrC family sensor kinase
VTDKSIPDEAAEQTLRAGLEAAQSDLRSAQDMQAAVTDILELVNRSHADPQPVFDLIVDRALRLCEGRFADIFLSDGQQVRLASHNFVASDDAGRAADEIARNAYPRPLDERTLPGKVILAGKVLEFQDVENDPNVTETTRTHARAMGYRSGIMVPMIRNGRGVGVIGVARASPGKFPARQVRLLQTFADQAALAVDTSHVFAQLQMSNRELAESLEYQTATSEALQVISRSTFDLRTVLDTLVATTARLCRADAVMITRRHGNVFRATVTFTSAPELDRALRAHTFTVDRRTLTGRTALEEDVVHMTDIRADADYAFEEVLTIGRLHVQLGVPLLREGVVVGTINLARVKPEPFTERQIEAVRTFGDQAVIAMENDRLLAEISAARDDAEAALGELRATQQQLVTQQKMAALGQLTAGIAHEIKNPLNFINNFAALSNELLVELKDAAAPVLAESDADKRAELEETLQLLSGNLSKIVEHGRRADGIVKSMLAHSRGSSGERQAIDLNAALEEAFNLAYHGARAQDQTFNITLERDYAPSLAPIEVVPQDITRVFLNLIGNGFYATHKRARQADNGYRPTLTVATRDLGPAVEIRIRDNGTGIEAAIRDKLFQPFFTTKPTGEGTGLGLSISHDIVTQQHGGTIAADSEPGSFTEFTIRLPRNRR